MRDRIFVITSLLVAALMLSMTIAPSLAFVYPDGSQDMLFENYGPRIDQILVKKYSELNAEMAALQNGEIDITDWALDKSWIDTFATDPDVAVLAYGGEAGYYTMNFNNNPNQYLALPQDPAYPNPVYPNPMAVKEFRQACSHLVDRATLVSGPGQGLYEAIYTPIPAYMAYFVHPEISYTGLLSALAYPPSIAAAAAKLDAGGFHLGGAGGKRYWDKNDNNVYDAGEDFTIEAYTRLDILRKGAADMLCNGFDDPLVNVAYTRHPCTGGQAWQTCMVEKNYHLYTAGWIFIGPDPDYMFDLYHITSYYHPEDPPNWGAISINDPIMQTALEGIKYAASSEDAQTAALAFQVQFATMASECPLGSTGAPKAYNKWYTGGNNGVALGDAEDKYRGQPWTQLVNQKGQGENSLWSTLNMYPGDYQYGDGNMIVRYGWKDNTMPQTLNPMYSSWYWESEAWGRCYDGLGSRDPMTLGPVEVPGIAENYTVGTWVDPRTSETLSKVTLTIRSDVTWSDGHKLDIDDVIYTFVDMPRELSAKGCPSVWWQPTLDRITGFFRLDAYTVEILMNVNTFLVGSWIAGNVVIPKHLWQPYIATHSVADISGDMSDQPEMLIGSGPFIYVSNTPETLLLVRNPTYYATMDKCVNWFEHFTYSLKKGITVEAVAPTTQLTPYKVKPAGTPPTASVHITIPVTNLDVNDAQDIHKVVDIIYPDSSVHPLANIAGLWLDPLEIDKEYFDLTGLAPGIYTLRVIVEVTSGDLFLWVHDHLDPSLWQMILGPRTVEKKFWVTVGADLNDDCFVDIFDIVIVGSRFGAAFGEPLYHPQADPNHDFIVDIFDIVQIALVFGWPG